MNNVVVVQIIDGFQHLSNGLGSVLLRELALLTNPVEQLSACRELGDDVVFVPRLEPVLEAHNVWVSHSLQHLQLVVYHLVIAFDVLLQDDLHGDFAFGSVGFFDDSVGASTQGSAHAVFAPSM